MHANISCRFEDWVANTSFNPLWQGLLVHPLPGHGLGLLNPSQPPQSQPRYSFIHNQPVHRHETLHLNGPPELSPLSLSTVAIFTGLLHWFGLQTPLTCPILLHLQMVLYISRTTTPFKRVGVPSDYKLHIKDMRRIMENYLLQLPYIWSCYDLHINFCFFRSCSFSHVVIHPLICPPKAHIVHSPVPLHHSLPLTYKIG